MLAVHLESGRVEIRETARPERRPGFALIRLLYGGICNTDLELQRGYYGFAGTPGHEFVGEVVEAETKGLMGRRVVGEINLGCQHCEWCARDWSRHCPNRTVLGIVQHPGAFREVIDLPERNLRVVPDDLALEEAVFTEPLAAACEIGDQISIPEGEQVAVLGDGKLGLLVAMVLQAQGAAVHLYGRHADKLQIAGDVGVKTYVNADLPAAAYNFTVDATGSRDGLKSAASMLRPRGTLVLKSTVHGAVEVHTAPIIVNEYTLVGSRCGRFEPALDLLRSGRVPVRKMIAARMPLAEAPAAFEKAAERGVLKVLLTS